MSEHRTAGDPQIDFILSLGRALHNYGYPAHDLEEALGQTASRLGLTAQFFSTPTSIFMAFGEQADQHTHLIRVEPGDVDLGRLARLHEVAEAVAAGRLAATEGRTRIAEMVREERYGAGLTFGAYAVASAGAARFLGGGWREMALALGLGAVVGLLAWGIDRAPVTRRMFEPIAAMSAAALATVAGGWMQPLSVLLATLAGLIILIPGLTLTVAVTELSTRHLVSGTARLAGAVVVFLTIAFGVAIGNRLGVALVGPVSSPDPIPLPDWTLGLAMLITPLAFVVLLRADARDAGWIVAVGGLAFAGGRLGAAALGVELGVFVGSLAVGMTGAVYARLRHRPAQVLIVPGILLLVPGSIGFRSLAWLMEREVVLGIETAFTTILMATALAAGLVIANVVLPSRPRPSGPAHRST